MRRWLAGIFLLSVTCGCSVEVAALKVAAPPPLSADVLRNATSCGWHDGESCRFWLLGIPFGLPQVDEAMNNAMRPVHGTYMRDLTVLSVHPTYLLFGWHCYDVYGDVCGCPTTSAAAN